MSAVVAMLLLTAMLKEAMTMYNSRGLKSYKELFLKHCIIHLINWR